jgi:hypothetical protein
MKRVQQTARQSQEVSGQWKLILRESASCPLQKRNLFRSGAMMIFHKHLVARQEEIIC